MNPAPLQARMAKRRLRKPGDLKSLQRMLWQSLIESERVLMHAESDDMTLKAAHCISQCAGQYAKLLEIGAFEARLAQVEATLNGRAG